MSVELLLEQTREHFPDCNPSKLEILPIANGGSDRRYYRVRFGSDQSLILVKYNIEKAENARFVGIARFLHDVGVNAPSIHFHDPDQGLIWMQDLGEIDLWQFRNVSWKIRRRLYESTLDQVIVLHQSDPSLGAKLSLQPGFNESLYSWEQKYCFENCLQLVFGISDKEVGVLAGDSRFRALAARLASYPRVLIHRDLQSQNVIVRKNDSYLIDFQGMRAGLALYDLASILMDPYVSFSHAERNSLLYYYFERNDQDLSFAEFEQRFLECAIQRLMQALGAYGVIGIIRGKPEFLRHIGPALKNLIEVASLLSDFKFFADFLDRLPEIP
jgi:N-acetylmuramate 1-kinase